NRATLARRYGPLAVVVAVQLLIIAAVPSKAPNESHLAAGPAGPAGGATASAAGSGPETTGESLPTGETTGGPTTATTTGGATAGPNTRGGGATPAGATGGAGATGKTQAATGAAEDTAHCAAGRSFDPAL